MRRDVALLAAGGTGGHLFPAEALAQELIARGWKIHLATDERAGRYAGNFPATEVHLIPSATLGSRNPFKLAASFWAIWRGFRRSSELIGRLRPRVVVGFGGYPTLPPLFAATRRKVPTLIHEQNAVMGRANRALAARVGAVAGGFLDETASSYGAKTVVTGNPVRSTVLEAAKIPYVASGADQPFNLLVFGGSQGAQFFSDAVPPAIALLPEPVRRRLKITQQARIADVRRVLGAYRDLGIEAEVEPFFTDMAARIAASHLVISRSGASTVSELAVIGRPALFVPYPFALDHDQAANAAALAAAGGAEVYAQHTLSIEMLARLIGEAIGNPERLTAMAEAARSVGKPQAVRLLADLTEAIAAAKPIADIKKDFQP
ncbi:undecaprenyldiphospho-muramoylpentapeptide beta-N-acetylglucosaminyltransferase [Pseudaminobacter sp. NGMCC 1.201702]|uniref:undecaprenyldiphospho-muramoylpentapeptide beta-N-acetylglucosaminyltransferase n=1 Tax=Pseudaminobacter sp. NGMCC 1.201702 TaxID=3391825 RepID=UPI0039F0DCF8